MRPFATAASAAVTLLGVTLLSQVVLVSANDVDTIYNRQFNYIISTTDLSQTNIGGYISSLQPNGTWADVNYASGCTARRASWPAGDHWTRIVEMATAYSGKIPEYKGDPSLRSAIRLAMEFWFANEMSTIGDGTCMDREFFPTSNCPCGTPGLWGPNWFSNVLQVPTRAGKACALLRSDLTESELGNCTHITARAYSPFYRELRPRYLGGANVMDIAVVGVLAGLLENNRTGNATRIADAYLRVHGEAVVRPGNGIDGIKPDGSFHQQQGIIYDGNYGKDFSNSLIELELQSLGTQFQANRTVQDTFGFHLAGSRWMTFTNIVKKVVHWDYTVIGRFISYPVADILRASANIQMNLTEIEELGVAWDQADLIDFASSLSGTDDSSANSGGLVGNRMFWNSDYMASGQFICAETRSDETCRAFSFTSQCTNAENPFGFHLSDGVIYSLSTGAEYEDMFGALDWNLAPGITTDYGSTPLQCATVRQAGVDSYAGGVQAGDVGMAAMRYVNPISKTFTFNKAWFFFPENVQHVLVSKVNQSSPNSTAPVFSVLDQRLRSGDVYVDGALTSSGGNFTSVKSLWHGGTGYTFPKSGNRPSRVSVSLQTRRNDWSQLGTSLQPASTVDMFAAWLVHEKLRLNPTPDAPNTGPGGYSPMQYSIFPATSSSSDFEDKARRLQPRTIINSDTVSAALSACKKVLGAAFWASAGGFVEAKDLGIKVEVDQSVMFILRFEDGPHSKGSISVADPTQTLSKVNIKVTRTGARRRHSHRSWEGCIGHHCSHVRRSAGSGSSEWAVSVDLPVEGMSGSTVTIDIPEHA
ncbi:Polysaccharide lyase family 8, N terminal alpha-helical domain [Rhizoctonia solani]|uniref:Polysaccharide lyase family 8, N terminal alpha-helical domain n=1 Tax=Rhizoctonia solani TaxID=456999 RepID=A0A8H7HGX0_9AGAM|nr:Polysaccharide lyase family 8, N terminal alpha-helical domain [Rhizoctonia solani]